jgi:hypothetical protein
VNHQPRSDINTIRAEVHVVSLRNVGNKLSFHQIMDKINKSILLCTIGISLYFGLCLDGFDFYSWFEDVSHLSATLLMVLRKNPTKSS